MCLILFSWRQSQQFPLVLAANRDEFYSRPTARANWWEDDPHVYAGRDLKAGGTWMGINRKGYWAALTNYREVEGFRPDAPSRGPLVADFLRKSPNPHTYLQELQLAGSQYNGFNLLLGTPTSLWYYGNRGGLSPQQLSPGLYGLSNHLLDTNWPKVEKGKHYLNQWIEEGKASEELFSFLQDEDLAPDADLPSTGVSLEWERMLSAMYIKSESYGTRVSTMIRQEASGEFVFEERAYVPEGASHRIRVMHKGIGS